jgi:hypothetical protein
VQAAPNVTAAGTGHVGEVVNLHTKLAARELPKLSFAPVVIVAMKAVLGARAAEGVKVAIFVAVT